VERVLLREVLQVIGVAGGARMASTATGRASFTTQAP